MRRSEQIISVSGEVQNESPEKNIGRLGRMGIGAAVALASVVAPAIASFETGNVDAQAAGMSEEYLVINKPENCLGEGCINGCPGGYHPFVPDIPVTVVTYFTACVPDVLYEGYNPNDYNPIITSVSLPKKPKSPKPIVTTTTINNDVDSDGFLANTDNPNLKDIDDNSAGAGIAGVAVAEAMGINVDPATEQGSLDIQIALSTAQDKWAEMTTDFAAYGVEVMTPTTTTTPTTTSIKATAVSSPQTTTQTTQNETTTSTIEAVLSNSTPEDGSSSTDKILETAAGMLVVGGLIVFGASRRRHQR